MSTSVYDIALQSNGHPDEDIKATRNIDSVYKAGVKLDRKRR